MDATRPTIADVNQFDRDEFVTAFGHVLEHSPDLAAVAWNERPFADRSTLAAAFAHAVESLDDAAALALLRAHPELGTRSPMAAASVSEQQSAGLDRATEEVLARLRRDNLAYRERFGFPFILAVRGRTTEEIASTLETRLANAPEQERAEALRQVCHITALRLEQAVDGP